jgi:DNA-binding transcriptional ArsR family regulator
MQATDNLRKPVRLGALSMAKVTRALLDGPCSVGELKLASGLSGNTLYEYLRALRKEGVVHICGWEKDATGRESLRVFKLGPGKDRPRAKKSKAQVARECRKRKQDAKLFTFMAEVTVADPMPIVRISVQGGSRRARGDLARQESQTRLQPA